MGDLQVDERGINPQQAHPPVRVPCDSTFVTQHIAVSAQKLVIDIPAGRAAGERDLLDLQNALNSAVSLLTSFYRDEAKPEDVLQGVTLAMMQLAGHRENVRKSAAPELTCSAGRMTHDPRMVHRPGALPACPACPAPSAAGNGWGEKRPHHLVASGARGRGGSTPSHHPVETQAALLKRDASPAPAAPARPPVAAPDRAGLWDAYDRRPQSLKDEAARRLSALTGRRAPGGRRHRPVARRRGDGQGVRRVTPHAVPLGPGLVAGLDPADWLAALVPAYTGRTAKAECDERAWDFFKAEWLRAEAPSIATAYDRMVRAARESMGWKVPSQRTVTRWANEIPRTLRVLAAARASTP